MLVFPRRTDVDVVFSVLTSRGSLAVVMSHVAAVGASDHSHRPSCHGSSCDKRC